MPVNMDARDRASATMNCVLCMDKRFLCETCRQLTPWPCPMEHDCYMPCPQCNPEGELPAGYE